MAGIGFVTDSTAHVPDDLIAKYDLRIANLTVQFGQESFLEHDLTADEFFRRMKIKQPTSSQPTPDEFLRVYEDLAKDHDSIIVVTLSHKLSGTINTARLAAGMMQDKGVKITVIDSLSAWMGTGLQAIAAGQAAADGKSHAEIVTLVERLVPKMQVLLVVDTLEYLQRGGRIGGAQALIGNMLQIKPLLCVRDGAVQPLERVRTKRKAIERVVEIMAQHIGTQPYTAAVGHAQAEAEAEQLHATIRQRLPQARNIYTSPVSPVIAVHIGPGALGLVYYVDPPAAG
ncbi:MAG: DegV family protein [Chloroflexi bacterium]|nr:MAG: DegV family protein [Chloroflexota bacterium]